MLELQTVRNPARANVHRVPCVQEAKTAALQPTPYAPPVLDVEAFAQDLAALIPSCPPSILHNTATIFLAAGCSADSISEVQAFNWRVPGVAAHFLPTSPVNSWYRELDATAPDCHAWALRPIPPTGTPPPLF